MGAAEYDLVSVGAGIGGLTAAIAAHEFGLRVLVLEKTAKLGGVAGISGGQCWVPVNHLAERAGIVDSVEEATAYLLWAGGGIGDEALARHYCLRARDAARFLEERAGVPWVLVPVPDPLEGFPASQHTLEVGRLLEVDVVAGGELGLAQGITRKEGSVVTDTERFAGSLPGPDEIAERYRRDDRTRGGSLAAALVRNVLERGIEIWTESELRALSVEGGAVTGGIVRRAGAEVEVAARRGVVLATGGYDSSPELCRVFEGRGVSTVSLTSVTGDHLRLAGMVGAKVISTPRPVHFFLEPDVPVVRDEDGTVQRDATVVQPGFPHAVIVNRHGRRFHDETGSQSRDAALSAIDPREPWGMANLPCWAVWDSRHVERYFGGAAPTAAGVVAAPTAGALAALVGISPEGLEAELSSFNEGVAAGIDRDFGRGARRAGNLYGDFGGTGHPSLGTIDRPPFYAVALATRSMGIGVAGLATDEQSRVIDWEDHPITGLYAAGNAVAMVELGVAYTGGNANARGMLHGFCAAEHAAAAS